MTRRIVVNARDEHGRIILTPRMLRKLRKALRLRVQDLSNMSGVAIPTIYQHEAAPTKKKLQHLTGRALVAALRRAGAEFRTNTPTTSEVSMKRA